MARTTAPLLSFDASGQIAKTQVYSSWKGRPYVRRYTVPSNPKTAAQVLTRSTFSWLNQVWRFMPATAQAAWNAYANSSRFTARNGWIKQNLSALRNATDLVNMTLSPAAYGGLPADGIVVTPGVDSLSVAIDPPSLPVGWTIVRGVAIAIAQQDPQVGVLYGVAAGEDLSDPYTVLLTGLTHPGPYLVGAFFEFKKPDNSFAYGRSIQTTATPT